jgi:hypothetical protein
MDAFVTNGTEKKTLKILFWCFAPIFLLVFLRLYWLVFGIIYAGLLSLMLGPDFKWAITAASSLTALVFAILTCRYLYRQFNEHIIGESR